MIFCFFFSLHARDYLLMYKLLPVNFFLATESLSQPVTVVPSGNAPTRVSPSLILSPKKNSLALTMYKLLL
jgi:hypothetical protein